MDRFNPVALAADCEVIIMATQRWVGQTVAVAQVSSGTIDSVDATPANNTFTVTIGGVAVSAVGDTDVATTATALRAALNASTQPYFAAITWSGSSGTITGTADTAGVPFLAALTETGAGTGAVTDFAATTANAGPNVLAAANFDGAALPGIGDTAIFEDSSVDILWALNALTSVTTLTILIYPTFTGKIGLNKRVFQTTASASVSTAPEYREDELLTTGATLIHMPKHSGTSSPTKSSRVLINTQASVATILIEDTASTASESSLEPVRIAGSNASNAITITGTSTVGIATNDYDDTAQFATIRVDDTSRANIGNGVTVATLIVRGNATVRSEQATMTLLDMADAGKCSVTLADAAGGTLTAATIGLGNTLYLASGAITFTALNWYGSLDCANQRATVTFTAMVIEDSRASLNQPVKVFATNTDLICNKGVNPANIVAGGHPQMTLRMTA